MIVVGYAAVLGLLVLGVMDILTWRSTGDADRLKRARLAGGAAWLFGVGASALAVGATLSATLGQMQRTPEHQPVPLGGGLTDELGPALLGCVGGLAVAAVATWLERRRQ